MNYLQVHLMFYFVHLPTAASDSSLDKARIPLDGAQLAACDCVCRVYRGWRPHTVAGRCGAAAGGAGRNAVFDAFLMKNDHLKCQDRLGTDIMRNLEKD